MECIICGQEMALVYIDNVETYDCFNCGHKEKLDDDKED